jgi:hypothetical protein
MAVRQRHDHHGGRAFSDINREIQRVRPGSFDVRQIRGLAEILASNRVFRTDSPADQEIPSPGAVLWLDPTAGATKLMVAGLDETGTRVDATLATLT